jgi:hypothetical protein
VADVRQGSAPEDFACHTAHTHRRNAMMPHDLAQALTRHGIYVVAAIDGDDIEDGDLFVAPNVHVQVPTFGERPRVVLDAFHGDFRCYPPRESVAELVRDIRTALHELPAALACSVAH